MSVQIERRYLQELRAAESESMTLTGYAAKFNSPSSIAGKFRETIAPGAFTRALAAKQDVRFLFNHDVNRVLGRTASGTLTLSEDSNGLLFRCQLDANNSDHTNIYSSVKRGDISECSFAFLPNGEKGEEWRQEPQGLLRTLKDVNLFDVSCVTRPAYNGTSVQARSEEALRALQFEHKLFSARAVRAEEPDEKTTENLRRLLAASRIF